MGAVVAAGAVAVGLGSNALTVVVVLPLKLKPRVMIPSFMKVDGSILVFQLLNVTVTAVLNAATAVSVG